MSSSCTSKNVDTGSWQMGVGHSKRPLWPLFFCTWELVFKSLASNLIFCENGDQITISKSCLASLDAVWTSIHVCQASFRMLLAAGHSFSRRWTNKFPEGSPRLFKAGALRSVCLDQRLCWASKVDLSICSIGRSKRACQCQKLKILSPLAKRGLLDFIRAAWLPTAASFSSSPSSSAPDRSGHCRTWTASARSQWALPDLDDFVWLVWYIFRISLPHFSRLFSLEQSQFDSFWQGAFSFLTWELDIQSARFERSWALKAPALNIDFLIFLAVKALALNLIFFENGNR